MNLKRKIAITLVAAFLSAGMFSSCGRKGTCPAYMNGAVTGTHGSSDHGKPLFPKNMKKQK
ncbi:MAG TPA: hypothetical protein DCQ93_04085 [Bacteroidetes bacterium]|nr:hypothetical protein [Bacteroidota bacterium]